MWWYEIKYSKEFYLIDIPKDGTLLSPSLFTMRYLSYPDWEELMWKQKCRERVEKLKRILDEI